MRIPCAGRLGDQAGGREAFQFERPLLKQPPAQSFDWLARGLAPTLSVPPAAATAESVAFSCAAARWGGPQDVVGSDTVHAVPLALIAGMGHWWLRLGVAT